MSNWNKSDKLKLHHTTYYSQEQLNRILGVKDTTKRVVGYVELVLINKKMTYKIKELIRLKND